VPDKLRSDLRRWHRDSDPDLFLRRVTESIPTLTLGRINILEAASREDPPCNAALGIFAREAASLLAGRLSSGSDAVTENEASAEKRAAPNAGSSPRSSEDRLQRILDSHPHILGFLVRVVSSLAEHDCAAAGKLAHYLRSFTRNTALYAWLLAIEGDMLLQSGRFSGVRRLARILERISLHDRTLYSRIPFVLFTASLALEENAPARALSILEPLLKDLDRLPARTAVRLKCLAADAYVFCGMFEEAADACEDAGNPARAAKDPVLSAVVDTHRGLVSHLTGDSESALDLYSRAIKAFAASGASRSLSVAKANCSLLLADTGDLDSAVTMQEEAFALAASTGDHAGAAKSLINLGNLHRYSGAFPRAVEIYNRAATLYPDSPHAIGLYANLAVTQMDMLLYEQAGRNLEKASASARKAGNELFLQRVKVFQGDLFLRMGLPATALERYNEVMEGSGRAAFGGIVLGNAARAMERLDADRTKILEMYDEASEIAERGMAGAFLSFVRRRKASLLLELGRRAEALAEIGKILEGAAGADSKIGVIDALSITAEIHRAGGNRTEEEIALDRAVALVEEMLPEVAGDIYRVGFMESIYPLYADLAALRAPSRPGDALAALEKGRTRALAVRSNLTPVPRGLLKKSAWLEKRMEEEQEGSELHGMLRREHRELQARMEWRKERHETLNAENWEKALQTTTADGDTSVISYSMSARGLTVIVAGRKGVTSFPVPCDTDELRRDCLALTAALDDTHELGVLESLKLYPWETSRRLARTLIEPVLPYLGDSGRLFIVRESFLHGLPFELLPVKRINFPGNPDHGFSFLRADMFLGFRFDIAYTFSLGLLGSTGHGTAHDIKNRKSAGAEGQSQVYMVVAPEYGVFEFERIPFAGEEAEFVAERLGRNRTLLLRGEDVSPETFRSGAGNKKIIHFAAHAIAGEKSPYDSGILMPDHRRMLTLHQISSTSLRAGLVFLSACSTAAGAGTMSEGVIGLTRSFIKAGADAVISTLWRVEDQSASMLVGEFYERFLEGKGSVRALAGAKRALLEKTISTGPGRSVSLAHPYFWAGFIHTGREIIR